MTTDTPAVRAEQNALDAVHEALIRIGTPQDRADEIARPLLDALRGELGGYLIDPVLAGMAYCNPIEGTEATREIYLFLDDTDADNMRVQTSDGVVWTTLDD